MEKIVYESRPYIYEFLGAASMCFSNRSMLFLVSGVLLIVAGISLLQIRAKFRKRYVMNQNDTI